MQIKAVIEALLFLAGEDGVEINKIIDTYHISEDELMKYIDEIKLKYENNKDCGLEIVAIDDTLFLKTKSSLAPEIDMFLNKYLGRGLSNSELSVLSIIAFNQPIMRINVDEIRGTNSSQILRNLVNKNFLQTEIKGRVKIYRTTDFFLKFFNLKSLSELPEIENKGDF